MSQKSHEISEIGAALVDADSVVGNDASAAAGSKTKTFLMSRIATYIAAWSGTLTNKTLDDAKFDFAIQAQTGTTYELVLADNSKVVTMDNGSANTLTIPANATVAFATGTCITVIQKGAGATTVSGAVGVTVNGVSAGSGALSARYSAVSLFKIDTDTWIASGGIGTVS